MCDFFHFSKGFSIHLQTGKKSLRHWNEIGFFELNGTYSFSLFSIFADIKLNDGFIFNAFG